MSYKRVTIGGTTFYPSTVDVTEERIGDTERMADGTLRFWHRAFKNTWTLTWNKLPESSLTSLRAKYRVTTSFTFNDENNTNWTVISTKFDTKLSVIGLNGIIYYDVTLELQEV